MIPFENIPLAAGEVYKFPSGNVLTFKSSTLPVSISFNGGPPAICKSGRVFTVPFNGGTITNPNALPVVVNFIVGDHAAPYSADDNTVGNVKHRAYCNLGLGDALAAAGGNPATTASGYLQITAGMLLLIPGVNGGNTRQSIMFDVAGASAAPLQVKDLTGNTGQIIPAGQPRLIVTDSPLKISGLGGVASVCITEIYMVQN